MTPKERSKWYFLTGLRAMLSVLDLLGILAIGFVVTSTAIFLTQGSSPNRVLNFAGLQIPAVTAETLPIVGFSILAIFLIKALFSILISRTSALFVATIEARAAKAIAERVFGGDLAQARLRSREDMSYAIQFGSPSAFNHLLNFTSTVAAEGSLFVMICLGFLLVDPWATLGAVAYFAIIALVIQYFVGTLMARAGVKAVKGTIEANGAVGDLISVFRELSVLKLRHKYIDRIYQSRISAAESAATQTYLNNMPRYIVEAALLIGVALFILVQALTGEIVSSAATIGVFLSGGFRLTAALLPLQNALLGIKAQVPVASRAHVILLESQLNSFQENNLADPGRTAGLALGPIGVEFQDVSFQYENSSTFAIKNVAFTIKAGQQVAFLGPSGAGKSTIADLMCGVARPAIGQVLLDIGGEDIPNNHSYSVSYVPQKPGIVSGSVSQNVALGSDPENINEREVLEAITRANLEPVISSLPLGIHTDLGNFHDALSGGQIQRLGLARALYSKPGLLVMDEATSALDAESEAEIAKALEKMRGKVTVVLIAHRLNTVQHADQVFLIEEGRIVDQGTFQELIRRNPSIVRLVQLMKVDED